MAHLSSCGHSNGAAVGSVDVALMQLDAVELASASYSIKQGTTALLRGDVQIEKPSEIKFQVGGIPAGADYTISLEAKTTAAVTCTAESKPFPIEADRVTGVSMTLVCGTHADSAGNAAVAVDVDSEANACPKVEGVTALPTSAIVGSSIALHGYASADSATFDWTAEPSDAGAFSQPTAAETSFGCAKPGNHKLTLSVARESCAPSSAHIDVHCTADGSAAEPVTAAADAGGAGREESAGSGGCGGSSACGADASVESVPSGTSTDATWTKLLNSAGADSFYDAAVDRSNNLYVLGSTYGTLQGGSTTVNKSAETFLAMYNDHGEQQWVRQFSTAVAGTNGQDQLTTIAVDDKGGIILAGKFAPTVDVDESATAADVATDGPLRYLAIVKYDEMGQQQWKQTLKPSTDTGNFWIEDVVTNAAGDCYITGGTSTGLASESPATSVLSDGFVAKLSPAGELQWAHLIGVDVSNAVASGTHVTADSLGAIYVAGRSDASIAGKAHAGSTDMFLAKFSDAGARQWISLLGTSDADTPVAVNSDDSGAVYIAGRTGAYNKAPKLITGKYDATGALQSTQTAQLPADYLGAAFGGTLDRSGGLYIAGNRPSLLGGNLTDMFIGRMDSGAVRWIKQFGRSGFESGSFVRLAGEGALYLVYSVVPEHAAADFADVGVAKYNPAAVP